MQIREFIPKEFVAWARNVSFEHIRQFDLIRQAARAEATTKLIVIGAATILAPIAAKNLLTNDFARYRPYLGMAYSLTLAFAAASTSDTIRYRRYADRGWEVTAETDIEAAEDLVQTATERKYELHSAPKAEKVIVEQLPAETVIPEPQIENVGQTVARSKLPITLVGSTGSGKTSVIERIIYHAHQEFSSAKIILFDGKPVNDRPILGIKTQPGQYFSVANYQEIPRFYAEMERVGRMMSDPNRSTKSDKIFCIVDELNNAVTKARQFKLNEASKPQNERDKFDYVAGLQIGNDLMVSQGREKNCVGIGTTHDPGSESMGQSMAMRSNNSFLILGSKDAIDNIEILLSGVGAKLIQNPRTLERLRQQYEAHKDLLLQSFYALTNIGGDWRIVRLPDYSQPLPMIWGASQTQEQAEDDEPEPQESTPLPYVEPQQSFPREWLDTPIRDEEWERVEYLWHERKVRNREEIVLRVWGVKKGGSRYYGQAIERVDEILK